MRVHIDLDIVRENASAIQEMVTGEVVGVVKGVAARRDVVDAFVSAGIDRIAVSRAEHLSALQDVDAELTMLRIPAKSELPDVVADADVTLHGSPTMVEAADEAATRQGVTHRVIPMIDGGEGREGVPFGQAEQFVDLVERLDGVELAEIGVNLGCYHDVPDPDAVRRVADRLPGYPISVGGSGMLLVHDDLPDAVSSYRTGDAPLTGKFVDTPIAGLRRGAVELRAEVLTSRPGEAVVDVGNINSDPRYLVPKDDVTIDRWSNEMAVIRGDVTEGDVVRFEMEYDAIATTFNSRYV